MPSLREQQQKFEHALFAGVGSTGRSNNSKQRIGKDELKEQIRQHRKQYSDVAVNISALRFNDQNICHLLEKTLAETNLDPRYMELEITEETFHWKGEKVFIGRMKK